MGPLPRFNVIEVGALRVTDAAFPAKMLLDWHTHDQPVFAVFLHGSMEVQFRRRHYDCGRTAVQVHPAGEVHRQVYGHAGARILVLSPDACEEPWGRRLEAFLSSIHHFEDERILGLARRAQSELAQRDDVTPLAVQSLAYEMLAIAARRWIGADERRSVARAGRLPRWLMLATEVVHAGYRGHLKVHDIAHEVGVHPGHLARGFRQHHHESLGSYVRRLRIEWVAGRLIESNAALSDIALDAGFADQSHLTRAFKRHTGMTPAEYRDRHRS